jgi:anti-sigma28 factor (negative regulator of flagellin synthesis)
MNPTQTAHSAHAGATEIDSSPTEPALPRDDQLALELGFAPPGGLRWRRRHVEWLRARVESGAYEVDASRVASSLVARLKGSA